MTQIQIIPPRVPYAVVVREDEATDGTRVYLAEVPALPGCMSHGETPGEALQNIEEACELYLQALDAAGVARPVVQHPPLTSGTSLSGGDCAVTVQGRLDIEGEMTMELVR